MYLIFLDTETTGLNPEKHRILEIAFRVIDATTERPLLSYSTIIFQPSEVWAAADPGSLAINGFQWEDLLHGKSEQVVASEISNDLNHLNLRENPGVFICQNPSFDRSFFYQLVNADLQENFGWPYHWLDLASMYWTVQMLGNRENIHTFKEHNLSKNEIAKHYGLSSEPLPHKALNGVNHLIACYEAIFGKFASLPS